MKQSAETETRLSAGDAEPAIGKPEDSLPVEIRGAKRQLVELLAKWQRQARGLVAVNNIAHVVVSSRGLDEILAAAVDEIEESLAVGPVHVILLDADSNQFVYHGLSGGKGTSIIPPASVEGQGPESIVSQVLRTGRSVRLSGAPSDAAGEGSSSPAGAKMCVPLLACDRVLGAIEVRNKLQHRVSGRAVPFDDQDQEVLEGVAAFVALAVENARLQEQTRTQAAAQVLHETVVTLSHYVNNPLQGMVAAAELLKEQLEHRNEGEGVLPAGETGPMGLVTVIIDNAHEIAAVLRVLQDVGLPESTTYVGSQQMLDIEAEMQTRMGAIEQ
jgi:transcriptional regulator with GAF, ATPase, and Fis domain